ncbi:MAG TPA: energy transducer TonB [Planctomycetota bacterium]|nr:energy transducer TonB [Planctomycetota bacterium]
MTIAVIFGVFCALVLHASFLLFGGLLFPEAQPDHGTLQQVELLSEDDAAQDQEEEQEPEATETTDELTAEAEEVPDAAEIIRNLELTPAAAPALDAASLSAIEAALSGQIGGGMGFSDAMTFASGGRIGGTGKPGGLKDELDSAFSLTDIDQKPRVIFRAAPQFPSEMRGKKIEGQVTVIFVVDASGKVTEPRVEKSNHPAFEKPALEAVRQWKFEPGVKSGERVPCKMRVPFRFQPS